MSDLDLLTPNSPLGRINQEINPSKAELDGKKIADDFDDFLLLLTTQLENQDPTEPLDTNEFTSQLVQFASVEQQVASNLNLEKLVAASAASGIQQGLGFVGKSVESFGNKGVLSGGEAVFAYELPQDAFEVEISILDSTGRAVFSGSGNTQAGKNYAVWDGVNSLTGQQLNDGTYQIVVNAIDAKREKIDAVTYTTGRVTSAQLNDAGETVLSVGNEEIRVNDVLSVSEIPSTSVAAPAVNNAANDNSDDGEDEAVSSDDTSSTQNTNAT